MIKFRKLLFALVVMTLVVTSFSTTARAQSEDDNAGEKSEKELNAEFCEAHPIWCEPSTIWGAKVDISACRADLTTCCGWHPIRCGKDPIGDKMCQPLARDAFNKLNASWKQTSFFALRQPAGYKFAFWWIVVGTFVLSLLAVGKRGKNSGRWFALSIFATLVVLIVLRSLLVGVELRGLMGTTLIDFKAQCSQSDLVNLAQDTSIFDGAEKRSSDIMSGWKAEFWLWLAEGDDPTWINGLAYVILGILLLIAIYHWKWWKNLNVVRKIGFGALAGYIIGTFSLETAEAPIGGMTVPDEGGGSSKSSEPAQPSPVTVDGGAMANVETAPDVEKVSVAVILLELREEDEEDEEPPWYL